MAETPPSITDSSAPTSSPVPTDSSAPASSPSTTDSPVVTDSPQPEKPSPRPGRGGATKAALRDILETALLTLVIFLGVRLGVQNFRVEGFSMEPTLHSNQYLFVNKLSYLAGEPQRGDIVVFRFPLDPRRDFIKRIIGLPGEEVEVRSGRVLINGRALDEPYLRDRPLYSYPRKIVPPGEYFVLGDNRNNSHDSHVWDWLPRSYIVGKAWVSYWPVQTWGMLRHNNAQIVSAESP